MNGRKGAHLEKVMETLKMIREESRAVGEICEITGFDQHTVYAHLRAGESVGLVECVGRKARPEGHQGSRPKLYRLVPRRAQA